MLRNRQKINVIISFAIFTAGMLMLMLPGILHIDMMHGGGALIYTGAIISVTFFIVTIIFFKRFKLFEDIFNNGNYIIHWHYGNQYKKTEAVKVYQQRLSASKAGIMVITFFMVVAGVIIFLIDRENGPSVFAILLGIDLVVALFALLSAVIARKRVEKHFGEAYISYKGLYYNGEYHTWNTIGTSLKQVKISGIKDLRVDITYSSFSRTGPQSYTVSIPVPPGEEVNAYKVVEILTSII